MLQQVEKRKERIYRGRDREKAVLAIEMVSATCTLSAETRHVSVQYYMKIRIKEKHPALSTYLFTWRVLAQYNVPAKLEWPLPRKGRKYLMISEAKGASRKISSAIHYLHTLPVLHFLAAYTAYFCRAYTYIVGFAISR